MRISASFQIYNSEQFVNQLLTWGNTCEHFILLNSNQNLIKNHKYSEYELIAAYGCIDSTDLYSEKSVLQMQEFTNSHKDWIFGFISYDFKNKIEKLYSHHADNLQFPEYFFFVPKMVFLLKDNVLRIEFDDGFYSAETVNQILNAIQAQDIEELTQSIDIQNIKQRIFRTDYINSVNHIKEHIGKGDVYELNFCQEFYAENAKLDASTLYIALNGISPAPFSVFMRYGQKYLVSSSPERFLAKRDNKIISQPIKGTIRRGYTENEDIKIKNELFTNEKERAENIMIVDLVRNDLSKIARKGTVQVEELCGIYSYPQVHQMISTISCQIDESRTTFADVISSTFPMGSMTGAPKFRAMELIEKFEKTKRGLYSGTVGYISPNGDFDFNVVIRSILYNAENQYLSFLTGSAITALADAEKEYDECLLKAAAMKKALGLGPDL